MLFPQGRFDGAERSCYDRAAPNKVLSAEF